MITRTLYRSYRHLFIGFLLVLSGCTSAPVSPPEQAPTQAHSAEDWLKHQGVVFHVADDARCKALMQRLFDEKMDLWREDIGE